MSKMPCSITDDVFSDPEYGQETGPLNDIDARLTHMVREIDAAIVTLKKAQDALRMASMEIEDLTEY